MENTLVVIPTLNEAKNVEKLLLRLLEVRNRLENRGISFDVLFVDDNSSDNTGDIILGLNYVGVFLLLKNPPNGFAGAYISGIKWAIERGYTYICQMDSDLSHRPEDLENMLLEDSNYDVVIGSRWIKGGKIMNWPLRRHLLSRTANKYARLYLGLPVKDITSGFRRIKLEVLQNVPFENFKSSGYGFQIEISEALRDSTSKEIPIIFIERQFGKSKMTLKMILESFILVQKLFVRNLMKN